MAKCLNCVCRRLSDDEPAGLDMRLERHRLDSLLACQDLCVNAQTLALQGFCLVAEKAPDEVRCVFCDVRIAHWDADDDSVREHLRLSNHCPLLRGVRTENVALSERQLKRLLKRVARLYLSEPVSGLWREEERRRSFHDWPGGDDLGAELAREGFFYAGSGWRVECIFCHMRWETRPPAGDMLARHSDCPLLGGRADTNVPLEPSDFGRLIYEVAGQRPSSDALVLPAERRAAQERQNRMPQRDSRRVKVVSDPMSVRYITVPQLKDLHMERNRLSTFRFWRGSVDKHLLASLGFFYTGIKDSVQCIVCRVQISNWHADTDIVDTHMRCSNCPLMRGLPTVNVPLDAPTLDQILDDAFDATPVDVLHPCIQSIRAEDSESMSTDTRRCKVCFIGTVETFFRACGHAGTCLACASRVTRCPFCQLPGKAAKLYFM
ncbi:death-associated inhibitor of apoptosis 1-like [Phlebotomus argentipes]|uniref:death-associated inhibitor of apoptosis 1-like n=1 Tax=Phlebotomus argentipes TaxID=94469 RepID=UPI00289332EF|nr:death-associated inhibitor of apoptosis 1-like [Phlebotomus argentipes]